jgi:glycosyltransferase involved in cell wall biosynthesis
MALHSANAPDLIMSAPSISVVTPVYNAERYVRRAVESALAQPDVLEILLIEDGSTDGSRAECEALVSSDPRVRVLRHPGGENRGAAASRNRGLRQAKGEFIAFLDADDYYLPRRFAVAMERLQDPAVDGVYEAIGTAYESESARERFLAVRGEHLAPGELTTIRAGIAARDLFGGLLSGSAGFCHLDGLTVRRSAAERAGMFLESLRLHQDMHFLLRLSHVGRLIPGVLDRPVTMFWVHDSNRITRATWTVSRPYMRIMWRDLVRWAVHEPLPLPLLEVVVYCAFFFSALPPRLRENGQSTWRRVVTRGYLGFWVAAELIRAPADTLGWLRRLVPYRFAGGTRAASDRGART